MLLRIIGGVVVAIVIGLGVAKGLELLRNRALSDKSEGDED